MSRVNDPNKNKGSVNVVMQGYHKGSKVLNKQLELIENDMNEEIKKFIQLKNLNGTISITMKCN